MSDLCKSEPIVSVTTMGESTIELENGKIRFLTFNTWGLKYVSKHRRQRLTAIAEKLAGNFRGDDIYGLRKDQNSSEVYDVIALQEVWCTDDWDYIVQKCKRIYPYYRRFSSGIVSGPGLAILSKIPIDSTFLYRFPINGRPSAFWRGDWYVGKSISVTLLKPTGPEYAPLAILNSHMHAPYASSGDASYYCHRSCQAWDFSQLANLYKKAGYSVVIVGDLNSKPGSLPHKFLTLETGLIDSWEQKCGIQELATVAKLSPKDQVLYGGTTCDSTLNTWRSSRRLDEACRLDYALIDSDTLSTLEADVRFTELIPNIGSFSDHFAYHCILQLKKRGTDGAIIRTPKEPSVGLLKEKIDLYNEMLTCIDTYMNTAKWQKFWRGSHFWISLILIIAILVATTFTSNLAGWSSILWILFAISLTASGLIDGFLSLLFGNKEIRALQEVYEEVTDMKKSTSEQLAKKELQL